MYEYPEELGKIPEEMLWGMININIAAVTMMTRMLINDMKARGKGAIVNLSSGSSLQPLPLMAVYSASKVCSQLCLAIQRAWRNNNSMPLKISFDLFFFSSVCYRFTYKTLRCRLRRNSHRMAFMYNW